MKSTPTVEYECDLCVVGGGLAGLCAAIAAARRGSRVVLMQDRPVLGGNSSGEIRMWVRGARGKLNRETGIISELEQENIYRNPSLSPSLWDVTLYGAAIAEKNLTLILNCSCLDAEYENGRIVSVTGWQLTTYTYHRVRAALFADCSGDSILSYLVPALFRRGREARSEFNERIGPEKADLKTMGCSILMQARQTGKKSVFIPPVWAKVYETDDDFDYVKRDASVSYYGAAPEGKSARESRDHRLGTDGTNFWWIELGGDPDRWPDSESVREELLAISLGIWDHLKNRGGHGADDWELEWIGFLPGKRESRRYVGDLVMDQNHVEAGGKFPDRIAYGGWPMDDHNPAGFYSGSDQPPSLLFEAPSPYGISYRCIYSKNVDNLFFAGRNISVTHSALSSTRVMATCALLGQAVGTAAALCKKYALSPRELGQSRIKELQTALMDDGVWIPGMTRPLSEALLSAECSLDPERYALLTDGWERPEKENSHCVKLEPGETLSFTFREPVDIEKLRLVFDPDFSRKSLSPHVKMQLFAARCNIGADYVGIVPAATLVKSFEVIADGETVFSTDTNHRALVFVDVKREVSRLELIFTSTWGSETAHLFSVDIM